jgi:hypothetical protein
MADNQKAMKEWCGKIKFPELKPLIAGTLFIEANAKMNEVEEGFRKLFNKHLPDTYEIVDMIPGAIWFVPAKENT